MKLSLPSFRRYYCRLEARLEAIALKLEAIASRLEAMALRLEAMLVHRS